MLRFSVIFLLLLACSMSSRAQTGAVDSLPAFRKTAFYGGLVKRAMDSMSPDVFRRCPTTASKGANVIVLKPLTFERNGFPTAGVWRESLLMTGCQPDIILNFIFSATPDEKIATVVAAPGTTIADFSLQRDALLYGTVVLGGQTSCKTWNVRNTKFQAFGLRDPPTPDPGAASRRRPWWETWTVVGVRENLRCPDRFRA